MIDETEQEKAWRYLRRYPFHKVDTFINELRADPKFHIRCRDVINEAFDPVLIEKTGWTCEEYLEESNKPRIDGLPGKAPRNLGWSERWWYAKVSIAQIRRSFREVFCFLVYGRRTLKDE